MGIFTNRLFYDKVKWLQRKIINSFWTEANKLNELLAAKFFLIILTLAKL